MELDGETGIFLVSLARSTAEKYIVNGRLDNVSKEQPTISKTKAGAFVTISSVINGEKELRGCIGFPYPDEPLMEAIMHASKAAATEDPRFPPLTKNELDKVVFEVSVLTPPELIQVKSPKELPRHIDVGKDGLIVEWSFGRGLLLPQVPVEYGWDSQEFLENACMKAGATPDIWLLSNTKVYKFKAIIFEEVFPRGRVERKNL
ncbi:MAG: TIGR00296 family protein [Thaumarchaeota archaeon]|nr:TIGR00296 family protein [Nitrososphaerota archaeon]